MATFPQQFGKYKLLRPFARGGMGQIFLASLGEVAGAEKLCVIKKLLDTTTMTGVKARFLDEAKVVVRLNHTNLVQVFDAGEVNGELYLAMELVEGRDLRAVWHRLAEKARRAPPEVVLHIGRELCRGLAYAHGYGDLSLVHRDVAPPNVLCSWSGEVKLTDFGLAASKLKSEHTAPGIVFGRLAYLAPEQVLARQADARSDLWSVGVILWEFLTGRSLHQPMADQRAMLAAARAPKIEPPSKWAAGLPASIDAVVLQALAIDRAARFQNAETMRETIARELATLAPGTDAGAVTRLLGELWGDEIERERAEREKLVREALPTQVGVPLKPSPVTRPANEGRAGDPDDAPTIERPRLAIVPMTPRSPHAEETLAMSEAERARELEPRTAKMPALRAAPVQILEQPSAEHYLGGVIDGRYRVEHILGQGGMGWVYEVEHIEIGKKLALKVLAPPFSREADLVARFRREARAASTIGHPNIVDVTDSGITADGNFYFVMERLEGFELGQTLRSEERLAPERAVHITTQMCQALAAAHAAGIIHRDLKPENVYLVTRGQNADFVKVLDFGIAKAPEPTGAPPKLTSPGIAMGTPEYMAPEQAAGQPIDARVDIYSVGAILYEMVTGMPPHAGANMMEVLSKKATEVPKPARELNPAVPEALELVIAACLAKSPDDRPQTMAALEYELNKSMKGRGSAVAAVLGIKATGETGSPWTVGAGPTMVDQSNRIELGAASALDEGFHDTPVRIEAIVERLGLGRERWSRLAGVVAAVSFVGIATWVAIRSQPRPLLAKVTARVPAAALPAVNEPSLPVVAPAEEKKEARREEVGPLIEWARRAADAGRWVKPPGDNLKELLDRVETNEPGNREARALRERASESLLGRAARAMKRRKYDEAVADYRALTELSPGDPRFRQRLAGSLAMRSTRRAAIGHANAALGDATEAVGLLPNDPSLRIVLGDVLFAVGRREQAADEYRRVLAAAPENKLAAKKLAMATKPARRSRR